MLIGISGKIGSGKDAFADRFISKYNNKFKSNFIKRNFGHGVKYLTSYMTGIPEEKIFSRNIKSRYLPEWDMTVGEFFQKLGTDAVRNNLHPDSWVLTLLSNYDKETDNWIISDVRFKNEANKIKEYGGVLIRLEGDPVNLRTNEKRNVNHTSETDLDDYKDFDFVFVNKPPIENIDNMINKVLRKEKLRKLFK